MIIRQFPAQKYEAFFKDLRTVNFRKKYCAAYRVLVKFDSCLYILSFQQDKHRKIVLLQAVLVRTPEGIFRARLVLENGILEALYDLLMYQGIDFNLQHEFALMALIDRQVFDSNISTAIVMPPDINAPKVREKAVPESNAAAS